MAEPLEPESPVPDESSIPRRDFLRIAGVGTGVLLASGCASANPLFAPAPGITPLRKRRGDNASHVVVIGAGAWGGWTSFHLRERGARVTMIDAYGPANSRATSGDETRGIRSSYGDRTTGEQWTKWARVAIERWTQFDAEWAPVFHTRFFMQTGDIICRAETEPFITRTRELWTKQGVKHEVMDGAEVRKRWPAINADDTTVAVFEPDAGVARARHSTQAVVAIAQDMGAQLIISRARPGPVQNGKMDGVILEDGTVVRGDAYVFACGPWLRKLFPTLMNNRMRVPLGYVGYFGTPESDKRFRYPNLPSYNFPGVTGWPVLPVDSRGFRVRGAIGPAPVRPLPAALGTPLLATPAVVATPPDPAQQDPDASVRWTNPERIDGMRRFVERRFPALANMPLLETRACHYESSVNRDFIVDHHPAMENAWIAGVGQAEGFKFAPVVGEYVAQRVLGDAGDPALAKAFRMPTEEYEANAANTRGREEEDE